MCRLGSFRGVAALVVFVAGVAHVHAAGAPPRPPAATFAVSMTNDANSNQIQVYDVSSKSLLQILSTHGKGGVGGNARGVKQYRGQLLAVVNNGSNTVAVYTREPNGLKFEKLVTTTSAPVSLDFGQDHLYVAGTTTVDSFLVHRNNVQWLDGTTALELAPGGVRQTAAPRKSA
jgi:hypothetical protein